MKLPKGDVRVIWNKEDDKLVGICVFASAKQMLAYLENSPDDDKYATIGEWFTKSQGLELPEEWYIFAAEPGLCVETDVYLASSASKEERALAIESIKARVEKMRQDYIAKQTEG